jgi:DNA-binding transcriptional MerR regulator
VRRPPAAYAFHMARVHGEFRAAEVGEMAGVSGTTVGQWARRGLICSSQRDQEPRVYSVEDVAEAAIVRALLEAGVRHPEIHRAIERLPGRWPLSGADLAVTVDRHIARRNEDGALEVLSPRGWQLAANGTPARDVRLRLSARSAS